MKRHEIKHPRGKIIITKSGRAQLRFKLAWRNNFKRKWQQRYDTAQRFVDSEVIRLSEPFTPLQTGMLVKSSILGTNIGSGEVTWIAPYARKQYYGTRKPGSETGALRGPRWFERMKAIHKSAIIRGARRRAGGHGGSPRMEVKG